MNSTFKENSNKIHAKPSRGLEYRLTGNGTYIVSGIGTCKDRDIVIPKTHNRKPVTRIGCCAFFRCSNLTNVMIPDGVTHIGNCAFHGCRNLISIIIPDGVTHIGNCAFHGCKKLQKIGKWKATNSKLMCRKYKFSLGEWHEESEAKLCEKGFHFCENAFDLFNYYHGTIGKSVRFFEVEADDVSYEKKFDSKRVCKKIKLVREIKSYAELLN